MSGAGYSPGEAALALHLRAYKVEPPVPQYAFAEHLGRAYRFDFSWPARMLAVEVDGAVHRIKGRFRADIERHNLAQLLGWRVLRFSTADVLSGKAIDVIRAWLEGDDQATLAALQRKGGETRPSARGPSRSRPISPRAPSSAP